MLLLSRNSWSMSMLASCGMPIAPRCSWLMVAREKVISTSWSSILSTISTVPAGSFAISSSSSLVSGTPSCWRMREVPFGSLRFSAFCKPSRRLASWIISSSICCQNAVASSSDFFDMLNPFCTIFNRLFIENTAVLVSASISPSSSQLNTITSTTASGTLRLTAGGFAGAGIL